MLIANYYRRRSLLAVLTLGCYWITLFVATHVPGRKLAAVPVHIDDLVAHVVAFAILAILFIWAFPPFSIAAKGYFLITSGILLAYALVDELLQILVPDRVAALSDLVADSLGILVVLVVYFTIRYRNGEPVD